MKTNTLQKFDNKRKKFLHLKIMDNAISKLLKRVTRFSLPVLILLSSVMVACTSSVPQELSTHEKLWKSQSLSDYDFTLERQAFAPEDWRGPVNIQVRNGTAVSVTYVSTGAAVTGGKFDSADTVDDLFTILKNAYTGKGEFEQFGKKADTINVTYDAQLGYPTNIYIDVSQMMADEEQGYTITDFVVQSMTSKDEHSQERAALQNLLDQEVKKQGILGMVMAVRLADGTVIWETSGYTGPSAKERWSANTPSPIASITKTFTAVVVMQLIEEGKLSLDDTVDTWFPEQPNGDQITVRMLLSHTSGLANFTTTLGMDPKKWTREWTPEELIAEANKAGPVGSPGSSVAYYSNTNYFVLGLIIEQVSGNSWAHEVDSRIIKPLGLKDTTFAKEDMWNEGVVPGYLKTSNGYVSLSETAWYSHVSLSTAWAAGGIVSTASDLVTFASALFDGKLVSRETLTVMTQPLGTRGGSKWALGGGYIEVAGLPAFGMGGDTVGYHAFFAGILDSKLVVAALVNTEEGDVESPSMTALQKYISQQMTGN